MDDLEKLLSPSHERWGPGAHSLGGLEFSSSHPSPLTQGLWAVNKLHRCTGGQPRRGTEDKLSPAGPPVMRKNQSPPRGDLLHRQTGNHGAGPLPCARTARPTIPWKLLLGPHFTPDGRCLSLCLRGGRWLGDGQRPGRGEGSCQNWPGHWGGRGQIGRASCRERV